MKVNADTLRLIAETVLRKFENISKVEQGAIFNMADYHGFLKSRLPQDFLSAVLRPQNLTPDDVQIEVVEVAKDLRHEVHFHEQSFAYCVCMGEKQHVQAPHKASAFLNDKWFAVSDGDVVEIPAGTPHGFTVEDGGTLTFLSVQAPPIVGRGHDDYHKIN